MNWSKIKYFKSSEFNHPDKLDPNLIYLLDYLRDQVGAPFVSHCDYEARGNTSQHCKGKADDGHFAGIPYRAAVTTVHNIVETDTVAMVRLMHPEFMPGVDGETIIGEVIGLGLYPAWNNKGFHIDTRGERARWGWTGLYKENGKKDYVSYEKAYNSIM